jgi:hypothetical protein
MGAEKCRRSDNIALVLAYMRWYTIRMRKPAVTYTLSDEVVAEINSYAVERCRSRSETAELLLWAGIIAEKQRLAHEDALYQQHVYEVASLLTRQAFNAD